jgi:hypothetical protein
MDLHHFDMRYLYSWAKSPFCLYIPTQTTIISKELAKQKAQLEHSGSVCVYAAVPPVFCFLPFPHSLFPLSLITLSARNYTCEWKKYLGISLCIKLLKLKKCRYFTIFLFWLVVFFPGFVLTAQKTAKVSKQLIKLLR